MTKDETIEQLQKALALSVWDRKEVEALLYKLTGVKWIPKSNTPQLETKDEPVAYINVEERKLEWANKFITWETPTVVNLPKIPLYTTPQRKPLTREDIDRLHEEDCFSGNIYEITAEIEAAHSIKE
jgi:hypothetical protein